MKLVRHEDLADGDYCAFWERGHNDPWRFFGIFKILKRHEDISKYVSVDSICVWLKDSGANWKLEDRGHWDQISLRNMYPKRYEMLIWKLDEAEILNHVVLEVI